MGSWIFHDVLERGPLSKDITFSTAPVFSLVAAALDAIPTTRPSFAHSHDSLPF